MKETPLPCYKERFGSSILRAPTFTRNDRCFIQLKSVGIKTVLVSHKTKHPYAGPKYDLHKSALSWLDKHKFFSDSFLGWTTSDVFSRQPSLIK